MDVQCSWCGGELEVAEPSMEVALLLCRDCVTEQATPTVVDLRDPGPFQTLEREEAPPTEVDGANEVTAWARGRTK